MSGLLTQENRIEIEPSLVGILAETSTSEIDAVIQQSRVAPAPVLGSITSTSPFVMVPKPYTSPGMVEITLGVDSSFSRTGILTPSGNVGVIQILTPSGTVLQFNGQDNEFSGLQLQAGVRLFARGVRASGVLNDFTLTLDLAVGPTPIGPPASISLTAVDLTLDICVPRTSSGIDPPALPQPTSSTPPASATDKWFGGRLVNQQDTILSQERAMLIVRQPRPATFNGRLQLRGVAVTGITIGALSNKAQLFATETPNLLQLPLRNPHEFSGVPANGLRFFAQGLVPSGVAARDMGFQLGFAGGEPDGDRVAVTVGVAPVIELASSAVVVKKPGVNPARKTVTLRTSSTFGGTGTLSRSDNTAVIKLFRSDGSELTFGTNPVFTDLELQAGVSLAAEGVAASGRLDDYQLTLTLTSTGIVPAGNPINARMTAVELTLDVALSRTAAGVEPPVMPQPPAVTPTPGTGTDKINLGRFVQVRDPGFSHERAMLIVRPPNPAAFAGTLVLTPINAQVQAFTAEVPATGQTAITPIPFPIPRPIPPNGMRLFVEATGPSTAVRNTGFRLGIQGLEVEADKVTMTAVQLEAALPTALGPVASTFVRFGLWDQAFDAATGNLLTGATDATHFIGADSRRLFFVVRDPNARGTPQLEWRTLKANGTDDDAPAGQQLQLIETPPNSHVFLSPAALLVTDDNDQQVTGTTLSAAAIAALRPRMRKVLVDDTHPLDGRLSATYTPAAGQRMRTSAVWFQRSPEERKRIRVHLVNVRSSAGGTGILLGRRRDSIKSVFHSIYARCGIVVEFEEFFLDPPASCIGWSTRYPASLIAANPAVEGALAAAGGNIQPSTSMSDICNAVRLRAGFNAQDIYVVYVDRIYRAPVPAPSPTALLVQGVGGQAFADAFTVAGSTALSFVFVGVNSGITDFADTHEATHLTTNVAGNIAGGHFDLGALGAGAPGNIDGKNLMHRFFLNSGFGIGNPKRLWNDARANTSQGFTNAAQVDAIRGSRYVRPF